MVECWHFILTTQVSSQLVPASSHHFVRVTGLWVMAAKHQLDEEKNPSGARALLQQGIRTNGDCKHLWLEVWSACTVDWQEGFCTTH